MKFWSIVKIIAGIIANLPFDANVSENKVREVVSAEVQRQQPEIQATVEGQALTPDDIEQIITHVVAIVLILIRSRNNVTL